MGRGRGKPARVTSAGPILHLMARFGTVLPVLLLALMGCTEAAVEGSGVAASDARELAAFTDIELRAAVDMAVTIGAGRSVTVTADDNVLPFVTTQVTGETLVIESEGRYSTDLGVRVEVVTPSLEKLLVEGSGTVAVSGLDADRFEVELDGSGRVEAVGIADQLVARLRGSGDVALFELRAREVEVDVDGSGDVSVTASRELNANVEGSGSVIYDGDPTKVAFERDGSGDVRQR